MNAFKDTIFCLFVKMTDISLKMNQMQNNFVSC